MKMQHLLHLKLESKLTPLINYMSIPMIKSVISGLAMLLLSGSLLAHTELQSSVPAESAKLEGAPEQVVLTFTGEVRLLRAELRSASGQTQELTIPSSDWAAELELALPDLNPGFQYLDWSILSRDGHSMSGTLTFFIVE